MDKKYYNSKNKTAYVVGGSGLIGSDIVRKLSRIGFKVINLDLYNLHYKNKNIFFEIFNLANIYKIKLNFDKIIKKYGYPDLYVNAAYPRSNKWNKCNYTALNVSDLKININLHLNSFIWSTMKIADIMKKNKIQGSIILLNSIYGKVGQDKELYKKTSIEMNPVYAAIKGGLITFIKSLSSYYGEYGIRANSIICGGIEGHIAGTNKKLTNRFKKKYSRKTLIKRMGLPSDISNAVIFLSSAESSYITGTEIVVDGGYTSI